MANWTTLLGTTDIRTQWARLMTEARMPACLLLVGREGIGKRSLLPGLAATILCPQKGCGTCDICQQVEKGLHPDVMGIEAETLGLEEAGVLQHHIQVHPMGSARIVWVPDVDRWTRQGINRLLKTLEELPPHAYVLFSTSRLQRLLPTLLSRCVRFPLPGPSRCDSLSYLQGLFPTRETEIEKALDRFGSIGRAHAFLEGGEVAWREALDRFFLQAFGETGSPGDLLGESLWNLKGSTSCLIESAEYALNVIYHTQLAKGQPVNLPRMRARRALLRQLRQKVGQEKIAVNSQLAGEALAL